MKKEHVFVKHNNEGFGLEIKKQCKQKQNIVLGVFLFFCGQSAECLLCLDCYFQTKVTVGGKLNAIHSSAHFWLEEMVTKG